MNPIRSSAVGILHEAECRHANLTGRIRAAAEEKHYWLRQVNLRTDPYAKRQAMASHAAWKMTHQRLLDQQSGKLPFEAVGNPPVEKTTRSTRPITPEGAARWGITLEQYTRVKTERLLTCPLCGNGPFHLIGLSNHQCPQQPKIPVGKRIQHGRVGSDNIQIAISNTFKTLS